MPPTWRGAQHGCTLDKWATVRLWGCRTIVGHARYKSIPSDDEHQAIVPDIAARFYLLLSATPTAFWGCVQGMMPRLGVCGSFSYSPARFRGLGILDVDGVRHVGVVLFASAPPPGRDITIRMLQLFHVSRLPHSGVRPLGSEELRPSVTRSRNRDQGRVVPMRMIRPA